MYYCIALFSINNNSITFRGIVTTGVIEFDFITKRIFQVILDEDSADKNKIREKADKLGFT